MCKRVDGSGRNVMVLFTTDPPYSKTEPGFVARMNRRWEEPRFTKDIWNAELFENRKELAQFKEGIQRKAPKHALLQHQATAQLTIPKDW